jgi:hypothetical protein
MKTLLEIFKKMFKSLEYGDQHAIWFEDFLNSLTKKNKQPILCDFQQTIEVNSSNQEVEQSIHVSV